jgi:hypothetical protein
MLKLQAISNTETSSVTSRPTAHINGLAIAFKSALLVLLSSFVVLFTVLAVPFRTTRKPLRKNTCERVKQYIIFQAPSNISEDPYT